MKTINIFWLKLTILGELINFFWKEKLWWLVPFVVVLVLLSILTVFAQHSAVAPFIYTIF